MGVTAIQPKSERQDGALRRGAGLSAAVAAAIAGSALTLLIANFPSWSYPVLTVVACIGLAGTLSFSTWAVWRTSRDWGHPLIILNLYVLLGWLAGGLYFLIERPDLGRAIYTDQALALAMMLALLFWVPFCGFFLKNSNTRPDGRVWGSGARIFAALDECGPIALGVAYLLGWAARAVQFQSGRYFHVSSVEQIAGTRSSFVVVALAGLPTIIVMLVLARRRHRSSMLSPLATVLVLMEVAWFAPQGARAGLTGVALGLMLVTYYRLRRIPKLQMLVAGTLLLLVVFPVVSTYRGNDASYQNSIVESGQRAFGSTFAGNLGSVANEGLDATFTRFADTHSAATVITTTRAPIAEQLGPAGTYTYLASSFVPRAIWDDKPDAGQFGNLFGRYYGVIATGDLNTSITCGQPLEALLTFGWLGVPFVGALLGSAYSTLCRVFSARALSPAALAVYAASSMQLLNSPGTIVATGLVGFVKSLGVQLVVLYWISVAGRLMSGRRLGVNRK